MLALISQGISIGFAAGASPGPLLTYIIQMTLTQGWRRSLILVLTPLICDIPVIVVSVFILTQIPSDFVRLIEIVGGVFVLYLAWGAWKSFRARVVIGTGGEPLTLTTREIMSRAMLVNWLSPNAYIFWSTVNGPLFVQGLHESALHGMAFLIAFYGTFIGVMVVIVFVFNHMRTLDPRIAQGILLVLTVLLLVFGLSLIGHGIGLI